MLQDFMQLYLAALQDQIDTLGKNILSGSLDNEKYKVETARRKALLQAQDIALDTAKKLAREE